MHFVSLCMINKIEYCTISVFCSSMYYCMCQLLPLCGTVSWWYMLLINVIVISHASMYTWMFTTCSDVQNLHMLCTNTCILRTLYITFCTLVTPMTPKNKKFQFVFSIHFICYITRLY